MSSSKKKMEGNPDGTLTSIGNYIFQKTLGEGNFAKVKLAKHKLTSQEVAVKIIDKTQLDEKKLSKLYREVRIMKLLHHPNIVKLFEVIETKYTIFLVMEYVSGGELYDYLVVHGRMKEKEARAKFRQILNAVSYCHKKRVIHRDLKAENLLMDANLDIKIADFGFSNQFDPDGKLDTFCGSPPYAAPELFQGKRYTGPEVDIWSLGVILYVLTTGCLPFDGKNLQEMRESVCRGKYRIPFYLSESCEKLLRKLLVRDPVKRPSLDVLIDDTWLNEGYDSSAIVQEISEQAVNEDPLVLSIMESKFGADKETILKGLKENVFDEYMAIYVLLYHEKIKNGEAAVIKIGEQMATKIPPPVKSASSVTSPSNSTPTSPNAEHTGPSNAATNTVSVIHEEDGSAENIAKNKDGKTGKSSVPPPRANGANSAARRPRRFTVSGEGDVKKLADEEKDDPELLNKVKNLQVNKDTVKEDQEPGPAENVVPRARNATEQPSKARPVSLAAPPLKDDNLKKSSEMEKAPPRTRTNTITGFLKLRRGSTTDSPQPIVPLQQNNQQQQVQQQQQQQQLQQEPNKLSEESVESQTEEGGESKPRSLRFTFNSNTTSSKPPDDIVLEIMASISKKSFKGKLLNRYLVECIAPPPNNLPGAEQVRIEIEVCKLPRLKNLHGLRFKRVSGASADYKTVCEEVLAGIQL